MVIVLANRNAAIDEPSVPSRSADHSAVFVLYRSFKSLRNTVQNRVSSGSLNRIVVLTILTEK